MLISKICDRRDFEAEWFRDACERMRLPLEYHSKYWEFCSIYQALLERGMLEPGKRGLGFGVGREPLAAAFASHGCRVTATDLDPERAGELGWVETDQHSLAAEDLYAEGVCDREAFTELVSFEHADMNDIPPRYDGQFDFTWSSCSLEHLGSLEAGKRFLLQQMNCLKPGGVAVHTTFYNLTSNGLTIERNPYTVIFRRRDIEDIVGALRGGGCQVDIDYTIGVAEAGVHADLPPYVADNKMVVRMSEFDGTSINLIITKGPEARRFEYVERQPGIRQTVMDKYAERVYRYKDAILMLPGVGPLAKRIYRGHRIKRGI